MEYMSAISKQKQATLHARCVHGLLRVDPSMHGIVRESLAIYYMQSLISNNYS
jgi:hypothetical protein